MKTIHILSVVEMKHIEVSHISL